MNYHNVILMLLAFSLFICILYTVAKRRTVFAVLLALWLAAILSETLLLRTQGSFQADWRLFGSYVDVFSAVASRELLRSNFMNAVLFYPAGFLAAVLLSKKKPIVTFFVSFAFSLVLSSIIELLQFRMLLGSAQTDDILHNVIGAMAGTAAFIIFEYIHEKKQKP